MSSRLLFLPWCEPPPVPGSSKPHAEQIVSRLRAGGLRSNRAFDELLPHDIRVRSHLHFTPLDVARCASKWIDEHRIGTVLDIGSGAGKFCVAAALAGQARYTGLEQRARLVTASRDLAESLGVTDRVTFVHGTFGTSYVARFEAYYLFNPFGENLFGPQSQIDGDVELSEERYARDIVAVEKMLHQAPPGIFLITYNGFGGKVPDSFTQVRVNREFPNVLQMWQKTSVRGVRRTQAGDSEFPHHFPS